MTTQADFESIKAEFNLKDADFYFLDLIPLIQVIWADGMNQEGELKLLYKFVIEHISHLDKVHGMQRVSVEDAYDFLERFADREPDPQLMERLLASFMGTRPTPEKRKEIMDYCLDIAAAANTHYPCELQERVMQSEKELLKRLFEELCIE